MSIYTKLVNTTIRKGRKELVEKQLIRFAKISQKSTKRSFINLVKKLTVQSALIVNKKTVHSKTKKRVREYPYVLKTKTRINFSIKSFTNSFNLNHKSFELNLSHILLEYYKDSNFILKDKKSKQENSLLLKKYAHFRWFS